MTDRMLIASLRVLAVGVFVMAGVACVPPPPPHGAVFIRVAPPAAPAEVITVSPGPTHYWVAGHHTWNGSAYVWVPGHWELRPRARAKWVPGRWHNGRNGWYWVEGHWR